MYRDNLRFHKYLFDFIFTSSLVLLIAMAGCSGKAPMISSRSSQNTPATEQPVASAVYATESPSISASDAFQSVQQNKGNPDFVIVDVRTADEFNSGHLANAINIDYYATDFKTSINKLDHNKNYLVYCQTGIRGAAATRIMLAFGFTNVHNMTGGITEWINEGYPIVK